MPALTGPPMCVWRGRLRLPSRVESHSKEWARCIIFCARSLPPLARSTAAACSWLVRPLGLAMVDGSMLCALARCWQIVSGLVCPVASYSRVQTTILCLVAVLIEGRSCAARVCGGCDRRGGKLFVLGKGIVRPGSRRAAAGDRGCRVAPYALLGVLGAAGVARSIVRSDGARPAGRPTGHGSYFCSPPRLSPLGAGTTSASCRGARACSARTGLGRCAAAAVADAEEAVRAAALSITGVKNWREAAGGRADGVRS
jgi:hypothetical protein